MEDEKEYYNDLGVKITNRRIIQVDGTVIAIAQVNSVTTDKVVIPANSRQRLLAIGLGIYLGCSAGSIITIVFHSALFMLLRVFLVLTLGAIGFLVGYRFAPEAVPAHDTFHFRITTLNGESSAFQSKDKAVVDKMVEALNQSVVENVGNQP